MQFLHTKGNRIVDESGREVLLEGYGLGNWMVQEGFLFGSAAFNAGGMRPFMRQEGMEGGRSIDQTIIETCGRTYAESFWKRFYENYFGEADVKDLAERGINSVRIPINARALMREEPGTHFIEEGFAALEKVIDLCEDNGIYTIIDLHAATAGQSALGCDDGWDNQAHLFTDEEEWERTIVLWEELARRYCGRACVAGYELLNEPLSLPFTDPLLPKLSEFYAECIDRIRKIDTKHILFIQGHRFASRADTFLNPLLAPQGAAREDFYPGSWVDPVYHNWVLTFHMYETLPDLCSLGYIFAASRDLDVPVWMGETGGSSEYMTVLYEMLREHHIGCNVWCHKGEESSDAAWLCSFTMPEEFHLIQDYAQKGGPKPSYNHSIAIFDQYLENIKFENCVKHGGRTDAILRKAPQGQDGEISALVVPAIGYDMLPGRDMTEDGSGNGSFFGREPYAAYCPYRAEDHMHIVYEPDFIPFDGPAFAWAGGRPPKYGDWPHMELQLRAGEYASYRIRRVAGHVAVAAVLRGDCSLDTPVALEVAIRDQVSEIAVPSGSGLVTVDLGTIAAGEDTAVRIRCLTGRVTLRELRFSATGACPRW